MSRKETESRPHRGMDGLRANVDACLYLAAPDDKGRGQVYVTGWVFAPGPGGADHLRVRVRRASRLAATVACDVERQDVALAFPDAPCDAGFEAYVPVAAWTPGERVAVQALWPDGRETLLAECDVLDAERLLKHAGLTALLGPRRRRKLANLVLNERERANKATRLRSKPIYLSIDPSFSCQLGCPCCHADMVRAAGLARPRLSLELLDGVLDRYGDSLIQAFFFLRGEPLLNPDFPRLVRRAHDHEIWTHASTNLSLGLTDRALEEIVDSGLDLLTCAVDGASETTYARYRRKGDFGLVLKNISRLVEARRRLGSSRPRLRWQFLEFPWHRQELESARAMADSMGLDEFYVCKGDAYEREPMSLRPRLPGPPAPVAEAHAARLRELRRKQEGSAKFFGCDLLYHQLCVNSDGSVRPCGYVVEPRHLVGRVQHEDVFNGSLMQANRALYAAPDGAPLDAHDPCRQCWVIGRNAQTGRWPNDRVAGDGHVRSGLSFFTAFELLTGRNFAEVAAGVESSSSRFRRLRSFVRWFSS